MNIDVLNEILKMKLKYDPLYFVSFSPEEVTFENELCYIVFKPVLMVDVRSLKPSSCAEWSVQIPGVGTDRPLKYTETAIFNLQWNNLYV